jgi:hypothetical protein
MSSLVTPAHGSRRSASDTTDVWDTGVDVSLPGDELAIDVGVCPDIEVGSGELSEASEQPARVAVISNAAPKVTAVVCRMWYLVVGPSGRSAQPTVTGTGSSAKFSGAKSFDRMK